MQPNRPSGTASSQFQNRGRFSFFPQDDDTPSTQQQSSTQQQPTQKEESSSVESSSFGDYTDADREYILELHKKNRPGLVPPNFEASNVSELQHTNAQRATMGLTPIRGVGFESGIIPPIRRPTEERPTYSFFPQEETLPTEQATLPPINRPSNKNG